MGKRILPERLKSIREAQGLTQKDLADETGLSQNAICKYENGDYLRESPNFRIIADFFGVSLEWLVGDEFAVRKSRTNDLLDNIAENASKSLPITAYRLREKTGKTITEVSLDTGIASQTIRSIENGIYMPRLDKAIKLAAYYGVSLDALCGICAE